MTMYKIFILLGACHMLKLIRNCLGSQGTVTNAANELIVWDFFKKVVELLLGTNYFGRQSQLTDIKL
jgi:hypothetical protein